MKKKFLPVFLAIILFFGTSVIQTKRAEAFFPAVIPAGAGIYALAALAGAGVLYGLGKSGTADDLVDYATAVWNGTTQAVKNAMNKATSWAIGKTGEIVINWAVNSIEEKQAIKQAMETTAESFSAEINKKAYEATATTAMTTHASHLATNAETKYPVTANFYNGVPNWYMWRATTQDVNKWVFKVLLLSGSSAGTVGYASQINMDYGLQFMNKIAVSGTTLTTTSENINFYGNCSFGSYRCYELGHNVSTVEQLVAKINEYFKGQILVSMVSSDFLVDLVNTSARTKTAEQWETTKDAGLVIDKGAIQGANPDLTFNPDGTVTNTTTGAIVSAPTVAIPVPVVTEVGRIAIPISEAGATQDVLTGEVTSPIVPPVDPPEGETSKIDWSKLKMTAATLTTVFPFSIPWDVYRLFSVLNVSPTTPVFQIDIDKTVNIFGKNIRIQYDFDINFSVFDPIAAIGRWGLILVFDIAIVMALRRLTPD